MDEIEGGNTTLKKASRLWSAFLTI